MIRECVKFPLKEFIRDNQYALMGLKLINVELYVDGKSCREILDFLEQPDNKKRLRRILIVILQNQYVDALYRREVVSRKTKDITAMKFKGGTNPRIYCREYSPVSGGKKIIMIHLLAHKDFQKNNKKIIPKLESIADYEYNFQ